MDCARTHFLCVDPAVEQFRLDIVFVGFEDECRGDAQRGSDTDRTIEVRKCLATNASLCGRGSGGSARDCGQDFWVDIDVPIENVFRVARGFGVDLHGCTPLCAEGISIDRIAPTVGADEYTATVRFKVLEGAVEEW